MAHHDELPVYKATYDLLLVKFKFMKNLKNEKLLTNETLTMGIVNWGESAKFKGSASNQCLCTLIRLWFINPQLNLC